MISFLFPESDAEAVIYSDPRLPNLSFNFLVKDVEILRGNCDALRRVFDSSKKK